MASLTIPNIDDDLKMLLIIRASQQGHSMEEEARLILQNALQEPEIKNLAAIATALFGADGGVDLDEHPAVALRLTSGLEE